MDENQAIVCLVGENIRYTPGVAARVFNALGGINVRMISQGASLLNLSFVVAEPISAARLQACTTEFFTDSIRRSSNDNYATMQLAIVGYGKMGRADRAARAGVRISKSAREST